MPSLFADKFFALLPGNRLECNLTPATKIAETCCYSFEIPRADGAKTKQYT